MNAHTKALTGFAVTWTDERLKQASNLWNDGQSAETIAAALGVSRSAVCGMAHRRRDLFPKKEKVGTVDSQYRYQREKARKTGNWNSGFFDRPKLEKVVRIRKPATPAADALFTEPLPEPNAYDAERLATAKELHDIGVHECRWPLNNGGPFLFCASATGGHTYCTAHHSRSLPKREVE